MNNLFICNTVVATLTNGVPIEGKGERNAKFLDVYMKVHIFFVKSNLLTMSQLKTSQFLVIINIESSPAVNSYC